MFNQADNPVKEFQREKLKSYIEKIVGNPKSMLTLSADNFLFESKFKRCKITSCENNPRTYLKGLENKPKNVIYKQKNIFEEEPKQDVVWLDLCVNLSVTTINELISYFQKSKSKMIALTVQSQREHLSKNLSYYGAKDLDDLRENVFPKLIKNMSNYKLVKIDKYRTNLNMIMYTFKQK